MYVQKTVVEKNGQEVEFLAKQCAANLAENGFINIKVAKGKKGLHVDYSMPGSNIPIYEYIMYS